MPDSTDYRKYLECRLDDLTTLMNARFNMVDADNKEINNHLKELNGTVKNHTKEIYDLRTSDALHIAECPALPKIESIEKNLVWYNFIKGNPKLMLIILAILVATMLISALGAIKSISTNKTSTEIRQSVDGVRYYLSPMRSAKPDTLDPDEVIKRMK